MHYKTKKKLDIIRTYIQRHYKNWHEEYPNLIGAYPGEKFTEKKATGKYSIVFLVTKKPKNISKEIPKHFIVSIPGEGKKKIPTDVVISEKFKIRSADLCGKIKRPALTEFGTTGVYLTKDQEIFACTNAHVLLPDMINAGNTHFFKPVNQQTQPDVLVTNINGETFDAFLQEGFFTGVDAAIARMSNPADVGNEIPGLGRPSGIKVVGTNELGIPLQMSGLISGPRSGTVKRVGLSIGTSIPGVSLDNLIETSMFSQKGDSGSPVFNAALRIIGILYGGTTTTSLIIPINDILNSFECELLI